MQWLHKKVSLVPNQVSNVGLYIYTAVAITLILSFIARIVEKEDNSKLIGAIVKHGQAQWFGYGIRLGFSKAEIDSICFDKPLMTDKLLAIILRKEDSDGKDGREILLEACRHVAHPFYGAVMDELGECRH